MYYAVKKGRVPGIYETWADCQKQTSGFSGAQFHKFKTIEECKEWIANSVETAILNSEIDKSLYENENLVYPLAFIDGSNNKHTKEVGYGVVIQEKEDGEFIEYSGLVDEKYWFSNNVSGEVFSAMTAINHALEKGYKTFNIYYDYSGIQLWGTFAWNSKLELVKQYIDLCKQCEKEGLKLNFVKIPSHTGVGLNDRADVLAKTACNVH